MVQVSHKNGASRGESEEELVVKKGAYVRVTRGRDQDRYGEVSGA